MSIKVYTTIEGYLGKNPLLYLAKKLKRLLSQDSEFIASLGAGSDGVTTTQLNDALALKSNKDVVSTLTYAATTNLDFDLDNVRTISLTGNLTISNTNKGIGKSKVVRIIADGTSRTLTFPSWVWMGTAPTTIAANKTGVLSLYCFGTADIDVVASYSVQS